MESSVKNSLVGGKSVEELYKLISKLPIEQQSELVNKILSGAGLVAIINNGCVSGNTINVGGAAKYEALAQEIEEVAAKVRNLENVRN